mmetsp:Transcript_15597/g.20237  ORF Transcript_15597/g.20237 Transcript_15597/m.20237 type:complete len:161 (-) Transcript_15597:85-567(-)
MLKDATIMIRMIVLPQSPKRRRKSLANLPTMRCIRREIASILRHTSTLRLPYCDGGFGSRKRKTHYQVEAQDVCKVFFKNMYIQYHTGDSAVSSEDVPLLKKPIGHILLSGLEFLASRQFVLKAVPVNKIQTTIQKTRMDRLWRLRVGRMWRFAQSKKLE